MKDTRLRWAALATVAVAVVAATPELASAVYTPPSSRRNSFSAKNKETHSATHSATQATGEHESPAEHLNLAKSFKEIHQDNLKNINQITSDLKELLPSVENSDDHHIFETDKQSVVDEMSLYAPGTKVVMAARGGPEHPPQAFDVTIDENAKVTFTPRAGAGQHTSTKIAEGTPEFGKWLADLYPEVEVFVSPAVVHAGTAPRQQLPPGFKNVEQAWNLLDSFPPFETSGAVRAKNKPDQQAHYNWVIDREKTRARWVVAALVMKGQSAEHAVAMYRDPSRRDEAKTLSGWTMLAGPEGDDRLLRKTDAQWPPRDPATTAQKLRGLGERRTARVTQETQFYYGNKLKTNTRDYLAVNIGGQTLLLDPHARTWADLRYWEKKPAIWNDGSSNDGSSMAVAKDRFYHWTSTEEEE